MARPTNRNKNPEIDETILEETPPNINEPQTPDPDDPDNVDPNPDKEDNKEDETVESETETETPAKEDEVVEEKPTEEKPVVEKGETDDQKEQRYKAQQTEAQIQAARNRSLIDRVDEAAKIPEPTVEELKAFVAADGVDWEELTVFEQAMAKKSYLAEKRFSLVNDAVQTTKKIDEWATKVDTFIDSTEDKPEYAALSSHEADFRAFCMKEAHRGAPIDILLGAFLHNLPAPEKKRGSLFERGGGGEKDKNAGKITDADTAATLRQTNPREYKRQVKAGTIQLEV